jgi:hypothetical protein
MPLSSAGINRFRFKGFSLWETVSFAQSQFFRTPPASFLPYSKLKEFGRKVNGFWGLNLYSNSDTW